MGGLNRVQVFWVLFNAFGIAIFLNLASDAWIEPELADVPGASAGDFIVWGFEALPVLLLFLVLHLFVGVAAIRRPHRVWLYITAATAACWVAAFFFDNAHHGS